VLLSTKRLHERTIVNLFRKVKLELHIFQQSLISFPPHTSNKARAKPPWVQSTPIVLACPTIPISKCFQSYGYIKKYADSGTQTNIVCFQRLLLARVQLPGLHKKYADRGTGTNVVCFRRLLLAHVQLPWLHKEICRQWDLNQRGLFPKATASTCSTALAT